MKANLNSNIQQGLQADARYSSIHFDKFIKPPSTTVHSRPIPDIHQACSILRSGLPHRTFST